jgi:hypothetical protein
MKDVLVLEELSAKPDVGVMLLGALPEWIAKLHAAYLEPLVPRLRQLILKHRIASKKGLKLRGKPR